MGLGKYIKKAFLYQWNLLAFAGSMGFAAISGHPDVAIPLVLAAETAYLGFIGTNPRFQKLVDVQDHKTARAAADASAVERLKKSLPPAQLRRFEALRDRCMALRQIAEQLRDPGDADSLRSLDELQLSDLDRLLWIYLRMLYTQHMLERFFASTSAEQIQAEARHLEERIKQLEKQPESTNRSRIRQSLQANLETCQSRLSNLAKARENHELLEAEIANLETKIQSVTEMAINRSDAGSITGQVEQITQGLIRTEQTINDLGFGTGIEAFDLTVPAILSHDATLPSAEAEPPATHRQRENEIRYL